MIAILLRSATIAVRSSTYILDIDVAYLVNVLENTFEFGKRFFDVLLLLRLRIRLICDFDVEVEARLALNRQGNATDDPTIRADIVDGNCNYVGLFLRIRLVRSTSAAET